jgi:putative ABC transport system permease protein
MGALHAANRAMFWRIVRRLLTANPGRVFVILLALGAGAAITAALLNLQVDARRRLTTEFRAFGANVIVTPRAALKADVGPLLDEATLDRIPDAYEGGEITKIGFLYVAVAANLRSASSSDDSRSHSDVIVVGVEGRNLQRVLPSDFVETANRNVTDMYKCRIGVRAARQLNVHPQEVLELRNGKWTERCYVSTIESFGGSEDNQIFTQLYVAQRLAGTPNRICLIQLSVPGTPQQIPSYITTLQQRLPEAEVRPIRQFTEGEAKIYNRISGLLTGTVVLVLVLTGLCVMAAMTNVAMERMNDVGLMKAIGGSARSVLRLFLTEAALLGLAGGIVGSTAGILLSIWLGKSVFGVAARPRLIVYPVAIVLTILVSIASAYPLRRLVGIRPAAVFRGEA